MRNAARGQVLKLGLAIVPHLIRACRSPDANLRWEAVDSLGSIRDFQATKAVLERVLEDEDVHVRWRSIWAITSLDDGRSFLLCCGRLAGVGRKVGTPRSP